MCGAKLAILALAGFGVYKYVDKNFEISRKSEPETTPTREVKKNQTAANKANVNRRLINNILHELNPQHGENAEPSNGVEMYNKVVRAMLKDRNGKIDKLKEVYRNRLHQVNKYMKQSQELRRRNALRKKGYYFKKVHTSIPSSKWNNGGERGKEDIDWRELEHENVSSQALKSSWNKRKLNLLDLSSNNLNKAKNILDSSRNNENLTNDARMSNKEKRSDHYEDTANGKERTIAFDQNLGVTLELQKTIKNPIEAGSIENRTEGNDSMGSIRRKRQAVKEDCNKNWLKSFWATWKIVPKALWYAVMGKKKENVPKHPFDPLLAKQTAAFIHNHTFADIFNVTRGSKPKSLM